MCVFTCATNCNGVLGPRLKMIQIIIVVLCYDLKYYKFQLFSWATVQNHINCIGFRFPLITIVDNVQTHGKTIQIVLVLFATIQNGTKYNGFLLQLKKKNTSAVGLIFASVSFYRNTGCQRC